MGKPSLPQAHKHDFYMLLIVEKGSGVHTIDFTEHTVKSKQIHFVGPGQAHNWDLHPKTTGYQLMFGPYFLQESPQQWPFFSFASEPVLQLTTAQFQDVWDDLLKIEKEYALADWMSVRIITHRLQALLGMVERYYEAAWPTGNQHPVRRLVKTFLALLEKDYKEFATVEYYAEQLHVTPQYLNIVSKKETGFTAGHCIRRRLLLEAKRMLTLTDQDVKEIAYELGFSDTSYFSRFFRRYTKQTPVEFRQEFQKMPSSS